MLELKGASCGYERTEPVLRDVDVCVRPGERIAVIGDNGSGKSALLLALALAPALIEGTVAVDGHEIAFADGVAMDAGRALAVRSRIGYVGQDPVDQLVAATVFDEVAFGPRNLGLGEGAVAERVSSSLAAVGLAGIEGREVNELSGGEQQRLALAAALALEPGYLLLDEVASMVDARERRRLRDLARRLSDTEGLGVVQVTHDPLEVLDADRVLVVSGGAVSWSGDPRDLVAEGSGHHMRAAEGMLASSPYSRALVRAIRRGYDPHEGTTEPERLAAWLLGRPEAVREDVLEALSVHHATRRGEARREAPTAPVRDGIRVEDAAYRYDAHEALARANLTCAPGEVVLVAGPSGAGKSTLAALVAGLAEPERGSVLVDGAPPRAGEVGLSFQRPEGQLFLESVRSELEYAPRNAGASDAEVAHRVENAVRLLGIPEAQLGRDPFELSGGEARRVAIASSLTAGTAAVVLDEPTSGLDARGRRALHALARDLASEGRAVLVISHDLEEWLEVVDRAVLLSHGATVWEGEPGDLMGDAGAFESAGLRPPESAVLAHALGTLSGTPYHADDAAVGASVDAPSPAPAATEASAGQRPRASVMGTIDVRVKLVVLFAAIVSVFAASPAVLAAWAAVLAAIVCADGIGMGRLLRSLRPALFLLAFIVLANLVSCDGSADIALAGPVGLSAAGGARALVAVARIALMVSLSLVVTASTSPTDIADACVRLARPLGRLGVPVDDIGLVLSLALRFVPIVSEEVARVRMAQRARGAVFDEGPVADRIRVWGSVLAPVIVGLFRRADAIGLAMDVRCYAVAARTAPSRRPLGRRDVVALAVGLAMAALAVVVSIGGW